MMGANLKENLPASAFDAAAPMTSYDRWARRVGGREVARNRVADAIVTSCLAAPAGQGKGQRAKNVTEIKR